MGKEIKKTGKRTTKYIKRRHKDRNNKDKNGK